MEPIKKIIDGCTAATYVAYAMSDVATIYPITPIASMGETADKWAVKGVKNVFGRTMEVHELESELGAAGATHGALAAGALACTFTSSQGLLLMIPNMYKIAGELLPGVFHVGTRSLAAQALSIMGDYQDVMAVRATGFAMLVSNNVQETMDLALVAHLAAIDGRVPVVHFFDGWRTSNEMATVEMIPYEQMQQLVEWDKVAAFRARSMNPEHPDLRGSAQGDDVYFQTREAANPYYDAFPDIVQRQMDRVAALTGRQYHLYEYSGAPDATEVVVTMGSAGDVAEATIERLNAQGYKAGVLKVRLFRPMRADLMLAALPETVRNIAVLDRTKEPGSQGEPLYLDVAAAVQHSGRNIRVIGGRYGLSSREFDPAMVKAVIDNAAAEKPIEGFTVGIDDDVTHLSLPVGPKLIIEPEGNFSAEIYGIGNDGSVGATKMLAAVLGDDGGMYAQGYFSYSAKKSGGYTRSQLRVASEPIRAEYGIEQADYVGCNKSNYVRRFTLVDNLKQGGLFVLNAPWKAVDLDTQLPARLRRALAEKQAKVYCVDATAIAQANNLGDHINTVMAAVFLRLTSLMPYESAIASLRQHVQALYMHEGGAMVQRNLAAIDAAVDAIVPIDYPASWLNAEDAPAPDAKPLPKFIKDVADPCMDLEGYSLPVSAMSPDGTMPAGTTAYEKRCIAEDVPQWDPSTCVECTECSLVCPHAAIRPVLLDHAEDAAAPADLLRKQAQGADLQPYQFRIQVYAEDCTGCESCALVCPGHALHMQPLATQRDLQTRLLDYCEQYISEKQGLLPRDTVRGSQLYTPMLEFSGACAGCGETPYVKLVTQLFGERMLIANATGCSSIWGANFPSNAYCTGRDGRGPAWGNSLFEDNAEYGYGMAVAMRHRRQALLDMVNAIIADAATPAAVTSAAKAWVQAFDNPKASDTTGKALVAAIKAVDKPTDLMQNVVANADMLTKKSVWAIGGDGWAYDIGFAGLDHVLASGENVNILVLDTECYSNTGGQMSKATPLSAVAKYASDGKRTPKKDLGRMMMTYGNVYVASVSLGANYQRTIDALVEAEAYPGPSIVICYCPCLEHGIRAGLGHSILEEREAVATGYWPIYRFNPQLAQKGVNPLIIDELYQYKPGVADDPDVQAHPVSVPDFAPMQPLLDGEDRYADLKMFDPTEAAVLQPELIARAHTTIAKLVAQANAPLVK